MWRVKTDAKFENSFFPVLIYWSDNRIHLGTIIILSCTILSPPLNVDLRMSIMSLVVRLFYRPLFDIENILSTIV